MGHRRSVIAALLAGAIASAQDDPAAVLIHTRDKLLAMTGRLRKYSCTETIDRSSFSRANPTPVRSCDQILGERKRQKMLLDRTDRLRFRVAIPHDAEVLSWTGTPPRRIKIDDLIETGALASGSFGTYLPEIFGNLETSFTFRSRNSSLLEFGFHAPEDTSGNLFRSGDAWRRTGYDGSLWIDGDAEELRRLAIQSAELPADTTVCETDARLDYSHVAIAGEDFLLPKESRIRFIERSGQESEIAITFSDCGETQPAPIAPSSLRGDPLPSGLVIPLALDTPIDTDSIAAGDPISARVMRQPGTQPVPLPQGAMVRGRVLLVQHDLRKNRFLVGIAFETLEINGVESSFYAKLKDLEVTLPEKSWPNGVLVFPARGGRKTVPSGMVSKWITGVPPQ